MRASDQFFRIDDEADSPAISSPFCVMLFWYGHKIQVYQELFTPTPIPDKTYSLNPEKLVTT